MALTLVPLELAPLLAVLGEGGKRVSPVENCTRHGGRSLALWFVGPLHHRWETCWVGDATE